MRHRSGVEWNIRVGVMADNGTARLKARIVRADPSRRCESAKLVIGKNYASRSSASASSTSLVMAGAPLRRDKFR